MVGEIEKVGERERVRWGRIFDQHVVFCARFYTQNALPVLHAELLSFSHLLYARVNAPSFTSKKMDITAFKLLRYCFFFIERADTEWPTEKHLKT